MGSRNVKKRHFKELLNAGGEVEVFFPSIFPLINPRLNFRNHRKIVVIDGRIGYIGGFNVGDEYLGLQKKFGYWRDTHLRIEGSAVHPLQTRFYLIGIKLVHNIKWVIRTVTSPLFRKR